MCTHRVIARRLAVIFLALAASSAWSKQSEPPEITEDGLHRLHDAKAALVYVDPEASLEPYSRVQILQPYVAFKKGWERDQRTRSASPLRISSKDIENIKTSLAVEFEKVFRETLEAGGYPVVEEAADDVLLLRPAIINLDVNAPDTPTAGRSQTFTESAGEMTLYLELYDSVTGDLLAKAMDRKADNSRGFYTWTNAVTNRAAADRILKGWAQLMVDALNAAHQSSAEANGAGDSTE